MSTLTLPWVLKSCLWANSKRYASLIYVSHTIEIFVIKPRTLNGSCAWLCMHYNMHGVFFVRGLAIHWGLQVRVLIRFDLQCYCHIPEGIGQALQVGEQTTSIFIWRPSQRTAARRCL
jgi:hypothetical protein